MTKRATARPAQLGEEAAEQQGIQQVQQVLGGQPVADVELPEPTDVQLASMLGATEPPSPSVAPASTQREQQPGPLAEDDVCGITLDADDSALQCTLPIDHPGGHEHRDSPLPGGRPGWIGMVNERDTEADDPASTQREQQPGPLPGAQPPARPAAKRPTVDVSEAVNRVSTIDWWHITRRFECTIDEAGESPLILLIVAAWMTGREEHPSMDYWQQLTPAELAEYLGVDPDQLNDPLAGVPKSG